MSSSAGSNRTPRTGNQRSAEKRSEKNRQGKQRKRIRNRAKKAGNGAGVIDMTESTDDDGQDIEIEPSFMDGLVGSKGRLGTPKSANKRGRAPANVAAKQIEPQAGPSNSGSVKGKEREKIPSAPVQEEKEEVSSAFKPMSRSIMSGWKLSVSRSPSPPSKRARTDSPQIEIFVDEKPDPAAAPQTGSENFAAPGLFSTSLIPRKKTQRKLREEEQRHAEDGSKEEAKPEVEETRALLLPEHITLESAEDRDEEAIDAGNKSMQDVEGLHIFDDSKAKGVQRYFDPEAGTDDTSKFLASADQSRICMNCKRPGHNQRDCPHILCPTCGKEDDHERRDCPYNLICFRCGLAGHKIQDCSKPRTKSGACEKCGAGDHTAIVCPTIWRMYSYYSEDQRKAVQERHAAAKGWSKEAVGGREHERWCYNCAQEGHFGDDCPRSRGSLARFTASAFSKLSQARGPFAASNSILSTRTSAAPTHQRWDASDDEDDKLPGQVTPFAGLGAGRKTIEKRKRTAMEQERQFGGSEPRHPKRKDGDGRNGNANGLPFGHRHFMTPGGGSGSNGSPAIRKAKGKGTPGSAKIQFGKLSMPGEGEDTPKRGSASTTLVNRALRQSMMNSPKSPTVNLNSNGNTSSPLAATPGSTSKRRSRKKDKSGDREEGEIEEIAFRKSGLGGGKVEGWGRELDEEEKKAKKVGRLEKKRAQDEKGGGAGGGGLSIKGRSQAPATAPGQKYHGSY